MYSILAVEYPVHAHSLMMMAYITVLYVLKTTYLL